MLRKRSCFWFQLLSHLILTSIFFYLVQHLESVRTIFSCRSSDLTSVHRVELSLLVALCLLYLLYLYFEVIFQWACSTSDIIICLQSNGWILILVYITSNHWDIIIVVTLFWFIWLIQIRWRICIIFRWHFWIVIIWKNNVWIKWIFDAIENIIQISISPKEVLKSSLNTLSFCAPWSFAVLFSSFGWSECIDASWSFWRWNGLFANDSHEVNVCAEIWHRDLFNWYTISIATQWFLPFKGCANTGKSNWVDCFCDSFWTEFSFNVDVWAKAIDIYWYL